MNVTIPNKKLTGTVEVPESKSLAHRWLIAQALSGETDKVICTNLSRDVSATIKCIDSLGISKHVLNSGVGEKKCFLNCDESATTYRLLLPIAAAMGKTCLFRMGSSLVNRPMDSLFRAIKVHGIRKEVVDYRTIQISGKMTGGTFVVPGNISSQFISGLLFAAPLLSINSTIIVQGPVESAGYIDLTVDVLRKCQIKVIKELGKGDISCIYKVPGNQKYVFPESITIEKDWSQAAFWLAAGTVCGGPVECTGLNMDSLQPDRKIIDIINNFGGKVNVFRRYDTDGDVVSNNDSVTAMGGKLYGIVVDAKDCPDLIPAVALMACGAIGKTVIKNAGRLRLKESDRIEAICTCLSELGADITEFDDGFIITGPEEGSNVIKDHLNNYLEGGKVSTYNDHRITMMCVAASCITRQSVLVDNAESVAKSYPNFFEDLINLQK